MIFVNKIYIYLQHSECKNLPGCAPKRPWYSEKAGGSASQVGWRGRQLRQYRRTYIRWSCKFLYSTKESCACVNNVRTLKMNIFLHNLNKFGYFRLTIWTTWGATHSGSVSNSRWKPLLRIRHCGCTLCGGKKMTISPLLKREFSRLYLVCKLKKSMHYIIFH